METHEIKKILVELLRSRKSVTADEIMAMFPEEDREQVVEFISNEFRQFLVFDSEKGFRFRHRFGPKPKPVSPERKRFSQVTAARPSIVSGVRRHRCRN